MQKISFCAKRFVYGVGVWLFWRMMEYNLMYYTISAPSDCAVSENYLTNKEINLKKIVQYINPDERGYLDYSCKSTFLRTNISIFALNQRS